MDTAAPAPEVFRPRRLFSIVSALSVVLWLFILSQLLHTRDVPVRLVFFAAVFIAFFAVSLAYYARAAIFVDARGVTYRGIVRTARMTFDEIRKLDVLPGVVTVYAIRTARAGMHFTSFFRQHRRLVELVIARAGLSSHPA
jgi:hypothetical protein